MAKGDSDRARALKPDQALAKGSAVPHARQFGVGSEVFARIWQAAAEADGDAAGAAWKPAAGAARAGIAHFSEPWYCCAEPTRDQFVAIGGAAGAPAGGAGESTILEQRRACIPMTVRRGRACTTRTVRRGRIRHR